SDIIGYISLSCWVVVMFPQIWLNYRRKSGEGVSTMMNIAWVVGDLFNITGAVMQNLVLSTILIGSYYILVDVTLLSQTFYYRIFYNAHLRRVRRCTARSSATSMALGLWITRGTSRLMARTPTDMIARSSVTCQPVVALFLGLLAVGGLVTVVVKNHHETAPGIPACGPVALSSRSSPRPMGTVSAIVYIMSYVPQAIQNYQRKSVEGLSIWLFILSLIANVTYALAILVVSLDPHYLAPYVPWLLGALVPCIIHFVILYQFRIYPSQ
ncbi:PQ-loop-domain-containing protein, partial [Linderina pennispora]